VGFKLSMEIKDIKNLQNQTIAQNYTTLCPKKETILFLVKHGHCMHCENVVVQQPLSVAASTLQHALTSR